MNFFQFVGEFFFGLVDVEQFLKAEPEVGAIIKKAGQPYGGKKGIGQNEFCC